jgi:hypothetical protein
MLASGTAHLVSVPQCLRGAPQQLRAGGHQVPHIPGAQLKDTGQVVNLWWHTSTNSQ